MKRWWQIKLSFRDNRGSLVATSTQRVYTYEDAAVSAAFARAPRPFPAENVSFKMQPHSGWL